jgi:hypothetical protein
MPRKEPFGGERLVIVACGVEHHFNAAWPLQKMKFKPPRTARGELVSTVWQAGPPSGR